MASDRLGGGAFFFAPPRIRYIFGYLIVDSRMGTIQEFVIDLQSHDYHVNDDVISIYNIMH